MDHLPNQLLSSIFQYLKRHDLIEASAVCIKWHSVIWTDSFYSKINETNNLFHDKDWLLKTYYKHFQRLRDWVYWECIAFLPSEKMSVIDTEMLDRMLYSVLPFCIWSHFWFCCRSQRDPKICQFRTKLQITNVKIINYINKKLVFDSRRPFPLHLNSRIVYVPEVSLFVHVRFGIDKQRKYSKRNFGVLQYEEISFPFLLFKNYLDILGRVILNHCDKYLLPPLLIKNHTTCCDKWKTFSAECFFWENEEIKRSSLFVCY